MGKFTVIPQNTFQSLQMDAGVILRQFDPANPVAPADEDIVCATTGGINPSCVPTYSDLGEDVDNVPAAMMELQHLDSWECKFGFTSLSNDADSIRLSLGAADIDAETGAIVPRKTLKLTDFSDLWWVGDRADGGCVAVQLKNALSTGGFSLQSTKNGKGQVTIELTGHLSLANQNDMPMVFYSIDPPDTEVYNVTQTLSNVTSTWTAATIDKDAAFSATLTAEAGYAIGSVSVFMGGVDITATAYNAETGAVSIGAASGNIAITATAVQTFSVTQTLTNVTSTYTGTTVNSGAAFNATLTADDTYTMGTVEVTMGGEDITATAYDSGTGAVTIASVSGAIVITATAS